MIHTSTGSRRLGALLGTLLGAVLGALPWAAQAHEGHGLEGSHWHATDVWGFVALGALVAAALWFSRKK